MTVWLSEKIWLGFYQLWQSLLHLLEQWWCKTFIRVKCLLSTLNFVGWKRERFFQFALYKVHKGFPKLELRDTTLSTAPHSPQHPTETSREFVVQAFKGLYGPFGKPKWKVNQSHRCFRREDRIMKFQSGSQTVWTTGRGVISIASLQNCSMPVQVSVQQASLRRHGAL